MSDQSSIPEKDRIVAAIAKAEQLGLQALDAGDYENAQKIFTETLSIFSQHAIGHYGLGVVALNIGDISKAEKLLKEAGRLATDWAPAHYELGRIYLAQGRHNAARRALEKAVKHAPDEIEIRYLYAFILQQSGDANHALKQLQHVLSQNPDHAAANNDIGCMVLQQGDIPTAITFLEKANASSECTPEFRLNFANALMLDNRLDEGLKEFNSVLDIDAENVTALIGAATAARRMGQLDDALAKADKAADHDPANPALMNLTGTILREMGRYDDAQRIFDRALAEAPGDASIRSNLGLLQLLQGDWQSGWPNIEARLEDANHPMPWGGIQKPIWQGQDLSDATIILVSEQGFGDTIQFSRFAPKVAEKAKKVFLAVQPELVTLLDGMADNIEMVQPDTAISALNYYVPLMNLPSCFGAMSPNDIDGAPYLKHPAANDGIKHAVSSCQGLKIGINWQGNPAHKEEAKRSIHFDQMATLFDRPDATFFNLNIDHDLSQQSEKLRDVSEHISSFKDTAALMASLDLVISVDTATVHLAGALGVPCWALIPLVPDWRWGTDGEASTWYNSVKLYRQPALHDWQSVIETIKADLSDLG